MLWPNNRFIRLLAQAEPHAALSRLEFWLTQPDETSRASALELAQRLLPNWNEQADKGLLPVRSALSTRFVQALIALQRPELLIQLMRLILNKNAIRPEGHDMLARALIFLGVEEGGPLLRSMVEAWSVTSFDACGLLLAHGGFNAALGWHPILVNAWRDLLKHMPDVEKTNAFGRFEPAPPSSWPGF